ncbi:MAG: hypothetical protein SFZ03_05690 [Candidatus Melainabacteria bacterium]|nr:hypothetical protein [Candidatus Melainabacteria bacterium]
MGTNFRPSTLGQNVSLNFGEAWLFKRSTKHMAEGGELACSQSVTEYGLMPATGSQNFGPNHAYIPTLKDFLLQSGRATQVSIRPDRLVRDQIRPGDIVFAEQEHTYVAIDLNQNGKPDIFAANSSGSSRVGYMEDLREMAGSLRHPDTVVLRLNPNHPDYQSWQTNGRMIPKDHVRQLQNQYNQLRREGFLLDQSQARPDFVTDMF